MMQLMLDTAFLRNQDHDDSLTLCPLPDLSQLHAKHQQEPASISWADHRQISCLSVQSISTATEQLHIMLVV